VSNGQAQLRQVLYDQHAVALRAHVARLTGDPVFADDVVQELLLRAWRHPEVLDQLVRSARRWLFTVARHIGIDDWRRPRSRAEILTAAVPEQATVDGAEAVLRFWLIADAVRGLTPRHRDVLIECFYRGQTVTEAAAQLCVPVGTVKSRCHYTLRALRLALAEMGVHGD
jgi:RNA polymerase sigma-70 factor (ECF subfamily)